MLKRFNISLEAQRIRSGRLSDWRQDLYANSQRTGISGALIGWFLNPGFAVATLHRVSRWGKQRQSFIGNLLSAMARRHILRRYGCDINPNAIIGAGLRLPHPIGVVIGDGVCIGARATIYQAATIGRRSEGQADYPELGDRVTIYAHATVVGPIMIGDDATIGARAIVSRDVPAGGTAHAAASRIIDRGSGL